MYNYINALMHLIFEDKNEFIRQLFSTRQNFYDYKQWLESNQIYFNWLENINENNLGILIKSKTIEVVEALLHINISNELNYFIEFERQFTHSIYINLPNTKKTSRHYCINLVLEENSSLLFSNPTKAFNYTLFQADHWPGILYINQKGFKFKSLNGQLSKQDESYFIHLSDLHLGTRHNNNGKISLLRSLDNLFNIIDSPIKTKFLITGDLMNSPNRKNMYLAAGLMNDLKKRYQSDLTFILGNHDMIVHGLNLLRTQKSKVVAYLLGENIKVLEKEKIILIKINSCYEGNLARGKVGSVQLNEIDAELSAIPNLYQYQLIVMIHHHVIPINKAQFLKKKWNEGNIIQKIADSSKALIDADVLIEWMQKHHIQYIFHGHKHIPYFTKHLNFYVISCGSSCGVLKESKIKYITYNVLKYNIKEKKMKVCLIYYDSMLDHNKRIELHLLK